MAFDENAEFTPDPSPPGGSASPTTLVLNYLKSKGIKLTGANVRSALEGNAQNPGLIAGLGNENPDPADTGPLQSAMNKAVAPAEIPHFLCRLFLRLHHLLHLLQLLHLLHLVHRTLLLHRLFRLRLLLCLVMQEIADRWVVQSLAFHRLARLIFRLRIHGPTFQPR